jgi:ubiquinone/menaquinone biosynthesis C-methylase UbiE
MDNGGKLKPIRFLRSNLFAWAILLIGLSIPVKLIQVASPLIALSVFLLKELSTRRALRAKYARGREITTEDIRAMQQRVPLRECATEDEFFRRKDGSTDLRKRARFDAVMRFLAREQDKTRQRRRVLDVGCGDGLVTKRLVNGGSRVVAIDLSRNLLNYTRRWVGEDRVLVIEADAEYLPFGSDVFDRMVMTETLEHLLSPAAALGEAYRALKWGGDLIITCPNKNRFTINPLHWASIAYTGYLRRSYRHRHQGEYHPGAGMFFIHNAFTQREIRILAEKAGFRLVWGESVHYPVVDRIRRRSEYLAALLENSLRSVPVIRQMGSHLLTVLKANDPARKS